MHPVASNVSRLSPTSYVVIMTSNVTKNYNRDTIQLEALNELDSGTNSHEIKMI